MATRWVARLVDPSPILIIPRQHFDKAMRKSFDPGVDVGRGQAGLPPVSSASAPHLRIVR